MTLEFGDDASIRVDHGHGPVRVSGPGTKCRTGCKTKSHNSYHECLRDAGTRTYLASPSRGLDGTTQKRWDRELSEYREARRQGVQPDGTTGPKVEGAMRLSDQAGAAYGRDFGLANPMGA